MDEGVKALVILTKLNGEPVVINSSQIEFIDVIPESKITMMNGKYHLVRESEEEIVDKVIEYNRKIFGGLKVEL